MKVFGSPGCGRGGGVPGLAVAWECDVRLWLRVAHVSITMLREVGQPLLR